MVQTLTDNCPGSENDCKTALIKAGFPYLDLDKKVAVLSGGEKARVMFLLIKLNKPNFLILDEPTNHIDIQGKQELESQILEANATVLITSHDRRFVDIIADRFILIDQGLMKEINDPQTFYNLEAPVINKPINVAEEISDNPGNEDEILQRIIELETRLTEDRGRKTKFQKPKMQEQWSAEIEQLNSRL
jgi:ABC-type multidrug transport system ATPase subunit